MEHIIQIAINVEDDRIVKTIEANAERKVIEMICTKVEEIIYAKDYWGSSVNKKDNSPLRNMVSAKVDATIKENKDFILAEAAKILADRLLRTKAAKAILEGAGSNG